MKLSKSEINNLFEALLDGYRDYDTLKMMVGLKLGKELQRQNTNTETVVFELINWAESKDKVLDLIWGANEGNPDNELIRKITYKLYFITKKQWEKLCFLISKIDKALIEIACGQSFKSSQIPEIAPDLVNLSRWETFAKIETILQDNLIKKRQQSSKNNPSILEFADYLSKMPEKEIDAIRNNLKDWVSEVANQLNIELQTSQNKKNLSTPVETKIIQPYLLISLEDQGSELFLQGELVIEINNGIKKLKPIPLYITQETKGVKFPKNVKGNIDWAIFGEHIIKNFILASDNKLNPYRTKKNNDIKDIIIELFLPQQFLFSIKMEKLILTMGKIPVKIVCQYPVIFSSLERFEIYQDSPGSLDRLKRNWEEFNTFLQSEFSAKLTLERKKFEYYVYCNEECQKLEQRLRDNEKIGINITSPLDENKINIMNNIIWAINVAGIPFALWIKNERLLNQKSINLTLEKNLIKLLTSGDIQNLTHLLLKIQKLRSKAYNSDNPNSLGYGLGFLCDNPYRVPSRFQEYNVATFD